MRLLRQSFFWLYVPLVMLGYAPAQTTTVTAPTGSITMGGVAITTGTALFIPVDINGHPIAVTKSGGGLNLPGSPASPLGYSCSITAGALGTCSLPDEITSAPSGFRYTVTITDTSVSDLADGQSFTLYQVGGITGTTYNLSTYAPTANILNPSLYSAAGSPLPACSALLQGNTASVKDATAPTFMGAYVSGGAITATVICSYNGTAYSWLTQ